MIENISLSFQGIWSHKLRSFLTMLGIIIGIASIIAIVSIIKGTNDQIKENLIGSGNNVVTVTLRQNGGQYDLQYSGVPKGVSVITEQTRKNLETLRGVSEVSLYRAREYSENVYYQNTAYNGMLLGVDTHYLSVNDYSVNYGRGFSDYDMKTYHKCAIVDSSAASTLFAGDNPVGKTIEIAREPFVVIVVAEKRASSSPKINSMEDYYTYSESSAGCIFIPTETWPIVFRYDEPQSVAVHAESTDQMTEAGKNVAKALTALQIEPKSKFTYEADDLMKRASEMQQMANTTNMQLVFIAGISLLVGGIGVMNIMLVSVTERTREIGLKKALGAKRRTIAGQFLTEAAVLTSFGGLLGVGSGIFLSGIVSRAADVPSSISIPACVIAVAFSMGIGILFGLLPAMQASKLNPIDALRSE